MNQTKNTPGFFQALWNFIRKISKAIVSGIPAEKVDLKPKQESKVHLKDQKINVDKERHYHRPVAKPVVEKQTLLKEKKKAKGGYKD